MAKHLNLYGNIKPCELKAKIDSIKKDEIYQKMVRSGGNNSVQRVEKRLQYANRIFG